MVLHEQAEARSAEIGEIARVLAEGVPGTPARGLRWSRVTMTKLRLIIEHDGKERTLTFDKLPVHIGRDASNECRLEFAFVSRRQCQLDVQDGRLVLRDEDSRQGTWVRGGEERLKPQTALDLASVGYEFQVGALHFRAEMVAISNVATEIIKPSTEGFTAGTVDLGRRADDAIAFRRLPPPSAPAPVADVPPPPSASSGAGPLETQLLRALEDYSKACGLLEALLQQAVARDPARASQLADGVQRLGSSLRMFIARSAGGGGERELLALRDSGRLAGDHAPRSI
jgi:predicted component of type VI protein secretion system